MGSIAAMETASRGGERYERRRQAIVAAATELLNIHGAKGMRLADVAAKLNLTTTSVTYYYKRKEDLAVACFTDGLDFFRQMTAEAARPAEAPERVRRFIHLYLAAMARVRQGQQAPVPVFSDIRALKEPHHTQMVQAFGAMRRGVAELFRTSDCDWMGPDERMARAHNLVEQVLWSDAWLFRYALDDFPRLEERMTDIIVNGLSVSRGWAPVRLWPLNPERRTDRSGQEMFLDAATRLINQRGYRGASVNGIAAELNLTKGSFYHHNEGKDDLVVACFKRSYQFMREIQRQVRGLEGDEWGRLASAAAALVEHQLSANGPLIRTSALSALPVEIRAEMVRRSQRVSDHFAAMVSDGVAEGCIRPVDPLLASQMITAMINAASDLPGLTPQVGQDEVARLYARPLLVGFFRQ
ncbi:MAG TPA: TetR/AcrR family transcriptional regulator [Caulobacteraceae bacterium]|nr:TetR/AcrR family transcriptional regulator [Caulobacteraceae bacterium]